MMYHVVLQIGEAHPEHCSATLLEGRAVMVEGELMVRCSAGFLRPAADWRESQAEAYRDAARRLEAIREGLGRRAAELVAKAEEAA